MRSTYKAYNKDGIYFITSTTIKYVPIFTNKSMCEIITNSLDYCRNELELRLFAYVIMDNHFHAVISAPDISKMMQSIKSFTAKKIIDSLKEKKMYSILNTFELWKKEYKKDSKYQVWQESYHPQEITSEDMFRQKIEYIHMNPVRRGLVERPEQWRFSSAANYMELDSVIEIDIM